VDHAAHATSVLVPAVSPDGAVLVVVDLGMPGFSVDAPAATLGLRGLDPCRLRFVRCRVPSRNLLGGRTRDASEQRESLLEIARLGVAATGVGLAQAAFEAALRYAQQRTTFGKPIAQHQAVQLKLADMATRITAARLLVYDAAVPEGDDSRRLAAKMFAAETAYEVALDSMRVHGGYGYTSEFPVERYYRDAARLAWTPTTNAADRVELARRLTSGSGARAAGR
jgi:alkylation response protein AidB-like acyl-CoA dehydrogenase